MCTESALDWNRLFLFFLFSLAFSLSLFLFLSLLFSLALSFPYFLSNSRVISFLFSWYLLLILCHTCSLVLKVPFSLMEGMKEKRVLKRRESEKRRTGKGERGKRESLFHHILISFFSLLFLVSSFASPSRFLLKKQINNLIPVKLSISILWRLYPHYFSVSILIISVSLSSLFRCLYRYITYSVAFHFIEIYTEIFKYNYCVDSEIFHFILKINSHRLCQNRKYQNRQYQNWEYKKIEQNSFGTKQERTVLRGKLERKNSDLKKKQGEERIEKRSREEERIEKRSREEERRLVSIIFFLIIWFTLFPSSWHLTVCFLRDSFPPLFHSLILCPFLSFACIREREKERKWERERERKKVRERENLFHHLLFQRIRFLIWVSFVIKFCFSLSLYLPLTLTLSLSLSLSWSESINLFFYFLSLFSVLWFCSFFGVPIIFERPSFDSLSSWRLFFFYDEGINYEYWY